MMEIKLTQKQFRRLLDLVYIGNCVLNSTNCRAENGEDIKICGIINLDLANVNVGSNSHSKKDCINYTEIVSNSLCLCGVCHCISNELLCSESLSGFVFNYVILIE